MSIKKYNIKAIGEAAEIRLTGEIDWWTNSGQDFMHQIDAIIESGIKKAKLYVNCVGGSTFEAAEIINQLKRFDSVTVKIGAIAASSASYIAVSFTSSIARNGLFMIHNPTIRVNGDEKELNSSLQLLQITKENIINAYVKKTGLSKSAITKMMDAETWMNATVAVEKGFVNSIDNEEASWEGISNTYMTKAKQVNASCGFLSSNNTETPLNNIMNKSHVIASLNKAGQNIPNDATESQVEAAVANLVKEHESLKGKLNTIFNDRVNEMLVQACNDKKIGQSQFEMFRKLAKSDYEGTKQILDSLPKAMSASDVINEAQHESDTNKPIAKPKSEWSLDDYRKNAPEDLRNNPELYNRLIEKNYGKQTQNQ